MSIRSQLAQQPTCRILAVSEVGKRMNAPERAVRQHDEEVGVPFSKEHRFLPLDHDNAFPQGFLEFRPKCLEIMVRYVRRRRV